jgi:hypothetical protein
VDSYLVTEFATTRDNLLIVRVLFATGRAAIHGTHLGEQLQAGGGRRGRRYHGLLRVEMFLCVVLRWGVEFLLRTLYPPNHNNTTQIQTTHNTTTTQHIQQHNTQTTTTNMNTNNKQKKHTTRQLTSPPQHYIHNTTISQPTHMSLCSWVIHSISCLLPRFKSNRSQYYHTGK